MDPSLPPHVGARLPQGEVERRSVVLAGAAGLASLVTAWVTLRPDAPSAGAAPAAPATGAAPRADGLPPVPAPPRPGMRPSEPASSGALGNWRSAAHTRSSTAQMRLVAQNPRGVHLLGDSISTRLLPELRRRLTGRPLSHDAWNGRPTHAAVDHAAADARAGILAPTVIVVSGSNDIFDPWRLETEIDRCRAAIGGRRLLWVTPYVSRSTAPSADMRGSALVALTLERAETAGKLEQVPWFEFLARSGADIPHLVPDGVHPSARGVEALAGLVLTTLG